MQLYDACAWTNGKDLVQLVSDLQGDERNGVNGGISMKQELNPLAL